MEFKIVSTERQTQQQHCMDNEEGQVSTRVIYHTARNEGASKSIYYMYPLWYIIKEDQAVGTSKDNSEKCLKRARAPESSRVSVVRHRQISRYISIMNGICYYLIILEGRATTLLDFRST